MNEQFYFILFYVSLSPFILFEVFFIDILLLLLIFVEFVDLSAIAVDCTQRALVLMALFFFFLGFVRSIYFPFSVYFFLSVTEIRFHFYLIAQLSTGFQIGSHKCIVDLAIVCRVRAHQPTFHKRECVWEGKK